MRLSLTVTSPVFTGAPKPGPLARIFLEKFFHISIYFSKGNTINFDIQIFLKKRDRFIDIANL